MTPFSASGAWQIAAVHFCWMPGARPTRARLMMTLSVELQRPSPFTSHFRMPGIAGTVK